VDLPDAKGQSFLAKRGGDLATAEEIVLVSGSFDAHVGDAVLHAKVEGQRRGMTEIERQVGAGP